MKAGDFSRFFYFSLDAGSFCFGLFRLVLSLVLMSIFKFMHPGFKRSALVCVVFGCVSGAIAAADSQDLMLVEGRGVTVRGVDLLGETQSAPADVRKGLLSKPQSASQLASNLYVRRALAQEAVAAGLEKDPIVQAQLQIAHDRVLSDAKLAKIDAASMPGDDAIRAYAQNAYRAEPARFMRSDEVHVRHILVGGTGPESRIKAEGLLKELNAGADFEALAKKASDDPGSAARGGDLDPFGRGKTVKPFEDAAFALEKPDQLSPIVESSFGFHIIKLVERKPGGLRPFNEVDAELKQEAVNKIVSSARQMHVQKLLKGAKFENTAIEEFAASNQ